MSKTDTSDLPLRKKRNFLETLEIDLRLLGMIGALSLIHISEPTRPY